MTALPVATDFTGASVTEGGFKTAITDQRAFLAGVLGTTGTTITGRQTLGVPLNDCVAKTGAYTVTTSDAGKVFRCSGTWTLTLPAAASAGDGFSFAVRNTGSGTITIDGDGTETIDGATTISLTAAQSALLVCSGTLWNTIGLSTSSGSGLDSAQQSSAFTCSTTETTVHSKAVTLDVDSNVLVTWVGKVTTYADATTVKVYWDTTLLATITVDDFVNGAWYDSVLEVYFNVETVSCAVDVAAATAGAHTVYVKAYEASGATGTVENGQIGIVWVEA